MFAEKFIVFFLLCLEQLRNPYIWKLSFPEESRITLTVGCWMIKSIFHISKSFSSVFSLPTELHQFCFWGLLTIKHTSKNILLLGSMSR